jgi:hypothetical protein
MKAVDPVSSLSQRVSRLEHQILSLSKSSRQFVDQIESLDRRLESLLRPEFADLRPSAVVDQNPLSHIEFPAMYANHGIISYLTKLHGGNVHETGVVTITSKSIDDPEVAPQNVADIGQGSTFTSQDEPGQWICWDFHDLHPCIVAYTLEAVSLQSWVIEGSLDGESWTKMDRRWRFPEFSGANPFDLWHAIECRFIRLTQTGKRREYNDDFLVLFSVEFYGTLPLNLGPSLGPLASFFAQPPITEVTNAVQKLQREILFGFPMRQDKSLDGIIAYLTNKHSGVLRGNRIAVTTSASGSHHPDSALQEKEPGEWVCWDFREMRVRVSDYTLRSVGLKSWVVHGSPDRRNWKLLDEQQDDEQFQSLNTASFAVGWLRRGDECRFILLTRRDSHDGAHELRLDSAEFFGCLSE